MDKLEEAKFIVIVDDDETDIFITKSILDKMYPGTLLHSLSSGKDLIDNLVKPFFIPDLILLDLNMPEMDGLETLKQFKTLPRVAHIPIIIQTHGKDYGKFAKAIQLGASGVLRKFDKEELQHQIIKELSFVPSKLIA